MLLSTDNYNVHYYLVIHGHAFNIEYNDKVNLLSAGVVYLWRKVWTYKPFICAPIYYRIECNSLIVFFYLQGHQI